MGRSFLPGHAPSEGTALVVVMRSRRCGAGTTGCRPGADPPWQHSKRKSTLPIRNVPEICLPGYTDAMARPRTPPDGVASSSEERSEHILETVLEVLHDVGYDQLRMQDVADRAGVGLSTIYRRWPTKQDLVRASLECDVRPRSTSSRGDPRADVKAFLKRMAEDLSGDGAQTMLGFLASLRADPEVAEVYRETAIARMQEHLQVAARRRARRRLPRPRPAGHRRPGDPRLPGRGVRPADGRRGDRHPAHRAAVRPSARGAPPADR